MNALNFDPFLLATLLGGQSDLANMYFQQDEEMDMDMGSNQLALEVQRLSAEVTRLNQEVRNQSLMNQRILQEMQRHFSRDEQTMQSIFRKLEGIAANTRRD